MVASMRALLTVAVLAGAGAQVARNQDKYLKRTGTKFLEAKAQADDVYRLPSGMLVKILAKGEGDQSPQQDSECSVHYHGTLKNGEVFDSSVERGTPATFSPAGVIRGWTEALQLMCVGDKWELSIPYDMAYGERGMPPTIPPFSPLVFEVELRAILDGSPKPCAEAREAMLEQLEKVGTTYDEL